MTKEDQLGKYPIVANKEGTTLYVDRNSALKSMDEYAKQQAIAFMQWNARMYTMGIDRQADRWFNHKGECVAMSTEELYGQFIASQNNPESFYYTGNQQQNKEQ